MPLTSADLPIIVSALQTFKTIMEAVPQPPWTKEERDHPVAVAGCYELAKAIAPEDIDGSDFPPRVKLKLLEVCRRVEHGPCDPNCTPDQWSVLLEDAIRVIHESGKLPPPGGVTPRRQGEAPEKPRAYALNWSELIKALGRTDTPPFRRALRYLSDEHNGPIKFLGSGTSLKVDTAELVAWWNGLGGRWEELARQKADQKADQEASVKDQYPHGREAVVVPNIGGHSKKKRKNKS